MPSRLQAPTVDVATLPQRTGIDRFRIQDADLSRSRPIATTPMGFVDAWLQARWYQASRWSAPSHLGELHAVHSAIDALCGPNHTNYPLINYKAARSCSGSPPRVQLQMDEDIYRGNTNKIQRINRLFFIVGKGNNSFTILSASSSPNPACTGPNTLTGP